VCVCVSVDPEKFPGTQTLKKSQDRFSQRKRKTQSHADDAQRFSSSIFPPFSLSFRCWRFVIVLL